MPVTVTVRTWFQSAGVNTSDDTDTVPSLASVDAIAMVTAADGGASSTTRTWRCHRLLSS